MHINNRRFLIDAKSKQAEHFLDTVFYPRYEEIISEAQNTPISVFLWAPYDTQHPFSLNSEKIEELASCNLNINEYLADIPNIDPREISQTLQLESKYADIIIAIIPHHIFSLPLLPLLDQNLDSSCRCILYLDMETRKKHRDKIENNDKLHQFAAIKYFNYPDDITPNLKIDICKTLYLQKESIFQHKIPEKEELLVLAFMRYLCKSNRQLLLEHLRISYKHLNTCINTLSEKKFIAIHQEVLILTDDGCNYLDFWGLNSFINLQEEITRFQENWSPSIKYIFHSKFELFQIKNELEKLSRASYEKRMHKWELESLTHKIKQQVTIEDLIPEEEEFLNHYIMKKLFEIWIVNIGGIKEGMRSEEREKIDFMRYMFNKLDIAFNPKHAKLYENYKNLSHSLGMLRPNNETHIYLSYSFEQRPLKPIIREYFDIAIITGRYDLILKRYRPYHNMLNLCATPGQRTPFDSRGIDFTPIIVPLNLNYSLSVTLPKTETRRNEKYLSIPAELDKKLETLKQAEIRSIREDMKNIFPSPKHITNIIFKDGQVFTDTEDPEESEEIEMYGSRRARYFSKKNYLTLFKGIPIPCLEHGLTIRFNLREPVIALLNGINGRRPFTLNEVMTVLKCLDIYSKEADKKPNVRKDLSAIINEVFADPKHTITSKRISVFIKKIEEFKDECPFKFSHKALRNLLMEGIPEDLIAKIKILNSKNHIHKKKFISDIKEILGDDYSTYTYHVFRHAKRQDDSIWNYLVQRLISADQPVGRLGLLDTLCHNLTTEGFDLVFSLWPLITGKELELDQSPEELKHNMTLEDKSTTVLPLIEILQRVLQDLLHDVFTKYVEISAATKRARSEPMLAELIVEACLTSEFDSVQREEQKEMFRDKIRCHLESHYKLHYDFLREIYATNSDDTDDILMKINRLHKEYQTKSEQIARDADEIIRLIAKAKMRLFERGISNRLLCFIDPKSVEVLMGRFDYDGIEQEEAYIKNKIAHKFILAEEKQSSQLEIRQKNIETSTRISIAETEHKAKHAEIEQQIKTIIDKTNRSNQKIAYEINQAIIKGDTVQYSKMLALSDSKIKGIGEIERILRESPDVLLGLDIEVYDEIHLIKLKELLIEILRTKDKTPEPLMIAAILSSDKETLVKSDIYLENSKILSEALKNIYLGASPLIMRSPNTDSNPS